MHILVFKTQYLKVLKSIEKLQTKLQTSMKDWAISKGATHYTHWFQPLTGATAEKHDAFFETIEGGPSSRKI